MFNVVLALASTALDLTSRASVPTLMCAGAALNEKVDSTTLPRLPSGQQVVVQQDTGIHGGVGGRVWPASNALNRWQLHHCDAIRGSRVLELGAGCGACGLYSAALGASSVVLTDANRHCCSLMATSATANGFEHVRTHQLHFESTRELPDERFDWIFGSDITYRLVSQPALAVMIRTLLEPCALRQQRKEECHRPRCILATEHRRDKKRVSDGEPWHAHDFATEQFVAVAAEHDLDVTLLTLEREATDVAKPNDVSVFEVSLAK
jgi:16S rRNA G966 N2-methylase RsmD